MRRLFAFLLLAALTLAAFPAAEAAVTPAFSTLVGGPDSDHAEDVAVDAAGNSYVTWVGSHSSSTTYYSNTYVDKYDAAGNLVWRTSWSSNGHWPEAIAVDGSGNVYVAGTALTRVAFADGWRPYHAGGYDAFAVKVSSTGVIQWASMLGGSESDWAADVDVDNHGGVFVTGYTWSCDFPVYGFDPFQPVIGGGCDPEGYGYTSPDVFVTKFTSDGESAVYSTFLGGSNSEFGASIAVSRSSGSALVVGTTQSEDFPVTSGAYRTTMSGWGDAFVAKLDPYGRDLVFATYAGGSGYDEPMAVARDSSSNVYVTGWTDSTDFPVTANAHQTQPGGGAMCSYWYPGGYVEQACNDGFVFKLDSTGSVMRYATYLGGKGFENPEGIAVDSTGAAYVTGMTNSTEFLMVDGRPPAGGWRDEAYAHAFAVSVTPAGNALAYSTMLDGPQGSGAWGVAVTGGGAASYVGTTSDPEFPTTPGAARRTMERQDGYLVKLNPPAANVVFAPYDGGEWWVQTALGGREANLVSKVEARDTGGAWVTLRHQPWGAWAASFHVEPGNAVTYRVTLTNGVVRESCAYAHPSANCTSTPGFDAAFTSVKGNAWWVEAKVTGNEPIAKVEASVNGGAWRALTLRSWGAWAASFSVPEGSIVQLRATSTSGATDLSGCYRWTAATPVECGGTDPGDFDATFRNVRGNEWWIETDVAVTGGTLAGVDARVNGGAWTALEKKSYGSWAKSIHAPAGSTVEFRARATDGSTDASSAYRWPPG